MTAQATPAGLRLHAPNPAELQACALIFAAGQREILPEEAARWTAAAFPEAVAGEQVSVATTAAGDVVGFLSLWTADRFVHFLHVRASWRGRGVGRRLLEHAGRQVDGPLELKCLLTNTAALTFYHHLGWVEVERITAAPLPFVRLRQPLQATRARP